MIPLVCILLVFIVSVILSAIGILPSIVLDVVQSGIHLASCFVFGFVAGVWLQEKLQRRLAKVSPPPE